MTRALIINDNVRARIKEVIAYCEAHPLSLDFVRAGAVPETNMLRLEDRKPGFERPRSAHVEIPVGYRAALSIEEQPPGFCLHLSISVDRKGKLPSEEAALTICEEFGMRPPFLKFWLEEFDPGHCAINIIQLNQPRAEGHA